MDITKYEKLVQSDSKAVLLRDDRNLFSQTIIAPQSKIKYGGCITATSGLWQSNLT